MFAKLVISLFIVFFSISSFSASCLLDEVLKDSDLNSNADFWTDYGKAIEKGKISDDELKTLVEKHGGKTPSAESTTSAPSFSASSKIEIHHKAAKEIKSLPSALKEKMDEFIEVASKPGGLQEIRNNPGRWHLEKMIELDGKAYTVRLNSGYRVLFTQKDGVLEVLRVNRDQIHNHLGTSH